jgi:uncharacterized membrane protein
MQNKTIAELADRWLDEDPGDLTELEQRVLRSAIEKRAVSTDRNEAYDKDLTFGERVADEIARVGGSWTFIFAALGFLLLWTVGNSLLGPDQFDPYPYILLNLVLSMLAALQAPVIMMSQNRQAARDRLDAAHDYQVNLKAEIEILALHDKLDEMRRKEILQIRDQLTELASQLQRVEKSAAAGSRPE